MLVLVAGASQAQTITEFSAGITAGAGPLGITAGPDGNVWFTENNGNRIGRITPTGAVTQYTIPTAATYPVGITKGPDNNLWFTEDYGNNIGRITTAGAITQYGVPTSGASPLSIAAGPDGKLWFTEAYVDQVGRITTAGTVDYEFWLPSYASLGGITGGPDGNVWVTETGLDKIARITPAGVITEFNVSSGAMPFGIVAGPDGNLWFTERGKNKIGRITPAGVVTEFTAGTTGTTEAITAGPDGNLWYTKSDTNVIGQITTAGVVTEYSAGLTANAGLLGITAGPDGNIWFTEYNVNKIGRVTLATAVAPTATTGTASTVTSSGATLGGTVSAGGAQTTVSFQYGLTTSYGTTATANQSPLAPSATSAAVSASIAGLTCGSLYHFRVSATNSVGTTNGSDQTFSTAACAPTAPVATTGTASAIAATAATLDGTVSASGAQTTVTFEYGLTTSYGTTATAAQSPLAASATAAAVSVSVSGLACNTIYHFRVTATNSVTTTNGSDQTFTTSACAPTVIGGNPVGSGTITATVSGCGPTCVFAQAAYIPVSGDPRSPPVPPPAGYVFPYGVFDFVVNGFTAGSTVTITLVYPDNLPPGTVYQKYGATSDNAVPHWYQLPAAISANTVTLTITDGGLGDDDLLANGSIVDQGGPAILQTDVPIPTLSQYALLLLVGIMGAFGVAITRRGKLN